MKIKTIPLSGQNPAAVLECCGRPDGEPKPAVVIYPGGGYQTLSETEREPIARFFGERGFQPFILLYSVGEQAAYPAPLLEGSRAVWEIRKNAAAYGVNPRQIALVGFSAGAHAATMLATCWQEDFARDGDIPFGGNRPDATVTGYTPTTFADFFEKNPGIPPQDGPGRLLGEPGTRWADIASLTTHQLVSENTPPAFLWKTSADAPGFSTLYAQACKAHGVECELHIFSDRNRCAASAIGSPDGPAGPYAGNTRLWGEMAVEWLRWIFREQG